MGELEEHKENWVKAEQHYTEAANLMSAKTVPLASIEALKRLGDFYIKGRATILQNKSVAIKYYQQAAMLGSTEALNALLVLAETDGEANYALAECYCEGLSAASENLKKEKLEKILEYLKKSNAQRFLPAKMKLAEITKDYLKDEAQACHYYIEAAEQGDKQALSLLPVLLDKITNMDLYLRFGRLKEKLKDVQGAMVYYHKVHKIYGGNHGQQQLARLANQDAKYAFDIGKLFVLDDPINALNYYMISARAKNAEALAAAESLSEKGSAEIQYKLAMEYFLPAKNMRKGVNFLLHAWNKGYQLALTALKSTTFDVAMYQYLAEQFEKGGIVKQDESLALYFYIKCAELQPIPGGFKVGEYYLNGRGTAVNVSLGCEYYLSAAKLNYQPAINGLQQMAAEQNPEALYAYGKYLFQHLKKDDGLLYYAAAAQCHHTQAKEFIGNNALFTQDQHIILATAFDKGADNPKVAANAGAAKRYYRAASHKGSAMASFRLGEYAENATESSEDPVDHFVTALHQKHPKAISRLEIYGKAKNQKACFALSKAYGQNNRIGIQWLICAADLGHSDALNQLKSIKIDHTSAFIVAAALDTGKTPFFDITQNLSLAFCYYKSVVENDPNYLDALYRIVQFYEQGLGGVAVDQVCTAKTYVSIALKSSGEQATAALEKASKIIEGISNWELCYQLGIAYEHHQQTSKAIHACKKAADNGHALALSRLNRMAQQDTESAYTIGLLYEQQDINRALEFYQPALMSNHEATVEKVKKLAIHLPQAMYVIARDYYVQHKQMQAAIESLMRAIAHQQPDALLFLKGLNLTATQCNAIAATYEKGEGIHVQNFAYAIAFRVKALNKRNPNELMHLAALCENNQESPKENRALAWEYYYKAAELGSNDAFLALERLARTESEDKIQALNQLKDKKNRTPTVTFSWNSTLPKRAALPASYTSKRN